MSMPLSVWHVPCFLTFAGIRETRYPYFARWNSAAYGESKTLKEIENRHSNISSKQRKLEGRETPAGNQIRILGTLHELEVRLNNLRSKLRNRERRAMSSTSRKRLRSLCAWNRQAMRIA